MFRKRHLATPALILGLLVIGAVIGIYTAGYRAPDAAPPGIEGLLWPSPKQIGEFTVVDHAGSSFGLEDLKGGWSFLFFGYTHCPDVCPLTLSVMDALSERLDREDVRMIFVTVDPVRDNTGRLAEYLRYFNEDFIGLGGTERQVAGLASQIGIAYQYGAPAGDGNYLVDHTSSVFLLDPRARLVSIYSAPHDLEALLSRFRQIEDFISARDPA